MIISIVDCGIGNLGAIANMLKRCGAANEIITTAEQIRKATKIILPGVGSFGIAMQTLREKALVDILTYKATIEKVPLLGICLGMQLLADRSEESPGIPGLGWIPGSIERLPGGDGLKIPHMGWNTCETISSVCPLLQGLSDARFYFVHSYRFIPANNEAIAGITRYGCSFASVVQAGNIMGVQFHPEKSHRYGLRLLQNFAGC